MTTISVIIPVYNSEKSLPELVVKLGGILSAIATEYEVIMVNDSSRDGSWSVITRLVEENNLVRGVDLMRNFGQHNAILCGIRLAKYEIIITMDDDLQHPPEEIPKLLEKLNKGYDVVYGVPEKLQHGFLRNIASSFTKLALQSAMGVDTARNINAFRIFRTQLREAFAHYNGPIVSIDMLLTWATNRFSHQTVRHDERKYGASNYNLKKLLNHAFNMITSFSSLPLQIASILGFLFTLMGAGIFAYTVVSYFINDAPVPGFTFLAAIISIFSGVQLFSLGIIGEYIARIHFRSMGRPSNVVRQKIGF